jgi:hypothetical protein
MPDPKRPRCRTPLTVLHRTRFPQALSTACAARAGLGAASLALYDTRTLHVLQRKSKFCLHSNTRCTQQFLVTKMFAGKFQCGTQY